MLTVYSKFFLYPLFVGFLLLFYTTQSWSQAYVKTRIKLIEGGTLSSRTTIGKTLTTVMKEVNRLTALGNGNFDGIKKLFTEDGFEKFNQLYWGEKLYSVLPEMRLNLLERPDGEFIVRGIKVWTVDKSSEKNRLEYLAFTINQNGLITNVRFLSEQYSYEDLILYSSDKLDPKRQILLDFLESYRTAFNRKDIEFIEKILADDAIIIVGDTTANNKTAIEIRPRATLDWKKRLAYSHKSEYIEKLRSIFLRNSFISVHFYDFEIRRHSTDPNFYAVYIKQRWNSSNYTDMGYIFLLLEFVNNSSPIIHMRSWQRNQFNDGSVVSLGNFEIIY